MDLQEPTGPRKATARASKFDPFLASRLDAPSGSPSAADERHRLARAHDWFDSARAKGRLDWSVAHPLGKDEAPQWLGYEAAAEDWCALPASLAIRTMAC